MTETPGGEPSASARKRVRRLAAFALVMLVQFGLFEVALRTWGSSEAAPAFQGLFEDDPGAGYRLKPNAHVRFTTSEFDATIATNSLGLRDEEKEVFLLRQNGDLTYEQIAEIRNAPVGTVKTQMRTALIKLRKVLNPAGTTTEDESCA